MEISRFTYDPEADCAAIYFSTGEIFSTVELGGGVIVDYTEDGSIYDVEILSVKSADLSYLPASVADVCKEALKACGDEYIGFKNR